MKSIDVFPWNENFNTGLAKIDEQHRRLVQLLNLLASHMAFQSDIPALNVIFYELADYAVYHFQTEEAIWHEYLKEDSLEVKHKKEHENFISTVLRLKAEENPDSMDSMIEKVLSFLVQWLASHILENDKYMAMVVLAMQSGMSQEQAEKQAKYQMDGGMKVLIDIILSTYGSLAINTIQLMKEAAERKQAEQQLRIAATAFESHEGILVTDANKAILRVNRAFTDITGYSAEEVIGRKPRILSSGRQDTNFYAAMTEKLNTHGAWKGEIWNRRKNGEFYLGYLTITAVKDQDDTITNFVGIFNDITKSMAAEAEIKHLAFYDPLTGLPNRRLLHDRLKQALASSARSNRQGALLFMDLDNFKNINDTLGHNIGDLLLQQVAQRLESCVREDDTVAHLGGDEFVMILEDLSEQSIEAAAQTESIATKILAIFQQPYQLDSHEYHCTVSIGVSIFSNHQHTQNELLKQADIAMYQAKTSGRNVLRFFDTEMQDAINVRVALERELHIALAEHQFELYYQPQVNHSHQVIGAEVLIRWKHPQRGLISPLEFIPLAEENGLILPIGQWVLEAAYAQLKAWQQDPLARDLVLAVNVSAKQFRQADFAAQVQADIQRHAINPMRLKLELTESMLLTDINGTIATMKILKEIGVQFSLDDFGTGYSSLQYLKRLPIDQLKIDQAFVHDIVTDSNDRTIVRTIIAMAQSLNFNIIAEGVETEQQRQLLLNKGCNHYQGYLFSKPVPIGQFEALLKQDSRI
ncbi:MAG TPA: bacteriohemerythrin [Methylobacter sp.]|jgi:diguanylate cyclase (GGDEF)-like protein/hemerythrin-like metal-binding protein/PAS domain S-box-containing protein